MKKTEQSLKFSDDDHYYMSVALSLAARGLGRTFPNPSVGCVIVKNNHIIGRGWTSDGGRPHAEVNAIRNSCSDTKGSTAYVTLEPCSHTGKTPPCVDALINAGVEKVFISTGDPDPRVSGNGIQKLKDAGVEVCFGLAQEEADHVNQGFFLKVEQKRPLVTIKIASSFDGKIAKKEGSQDWVTGPESRRRGHLYRANHDAIMIGSNTAKIDDPMLDCRINGLEKYSPIRILMDTNLNISLNSKLCMSANEIPVWVMTASHDEAKTRHLIERGVKVINVDKNEDGQINLSSALSQLSELGITRILSEGGGQLNASLLKASLVDRLLWFRSLNIIGENGVDALYNLSINDYVNDEVVTEIRSGKTGLDIWAEYKKN